jgi:Asp-tRNA(Asn)/Glu-tRNA(Gln) amidotransferase C subunit
MADDTAQLTVMAVRELAALAGVRLDDERAARLLPQLQAVLAALAAVDERELAGAEPATFFSLEAFSPEQTHG